MDEHGGRARFTLSEPLTFFSGARMETQRKAQSKDGALLIVEQQFGPTVCQVYFVSQGIPAHRTQGADPSFSAPRCA